MLSFIMPCVVRVVLSISPFPLFSSAARLPPNKRGGGGRRPANQVPFSLSSLSCLMLAVGDANATVEPTEHKRA